MTPLFPTLFEEIVFWAFLLGTLVTFDMFAFRNRAERAIKSKIDRSDSLLALLTILVPIVIGYARIGILPSWLFYPGLVTGAVGFIIIFWSMHTLGRFYSPALQVVSGHRVIETGPYRLIRHPMYAGVTLASIGIGLALQSWVGLLFILIVSSIRFFLRIRKEEGLLASELGEEYVQYMKRTKRIIPFVL